METSEDESSSTIDLPPKIVVNRYRLSDIDSTLPLYIIPIVLSFRTFSNHEHINCVFLKNDHYGTLVYRSVIC
jgi:hypothetical protein